MEEFNVTYNEVPYIICADFDGEDGRIFDYEFYPKRGDSISLDNDLQFELYCLMEQEIQEHLTEQACEHKNLGYEEWHCNYGR